MTFPRRLSKKEIEVAYLERFRLAMPGLPKGKIEPSEEPDFMIRRAGSVLGIEITELHRETQPGASPQQARQTMRERVISRAQEIYVASDQPAARVSVFMNDSVHIETSSVEHFAGQICGLAIRNLPSQNSSGEESYEWSNRAYFPDLVRCWLKGTLGDALQALSCAAGYNIRWLLRAIAGKAAKDAKAFLLALWGTAVWRRLAAERVFQMFADAVGLLIDARRCWIGLRSARLASLGLCRLA
jgi:hypothetical protein